MHSITSKGTNRLDIEFSGKIDSTEMKALLDELASKSQDIEHGQMLYRIGDFDFPTMGAIGVELSRIPQMFRLMKKFDRAAVLSDKKWVRKISEIEGALFPGLDIKAFESGQEDEAESWLTR